MKSGRRPIDTSRTWAVGLPRKSFKAIKKRAEFHALLALARQVNLLRFAQGSILGTEGRSSPFSRRAGLNSMFLTCSILFECHARLIPELGKHFRSTPDFSALKDWCTDKKVKRFIQKHCEPVRNEATFHVDWDVMSERLEVLSEPFVVFMSSRGKVAGLNTYDLADFLAVQALVGPCRDGRTFKRKSTVVAARGARIAKRFLLASETLIAGHLKSGPFVARQVRHTTEAETVIGLLGRS